MTCGFCNGTFEVPAEMVDHRQYPKADPQFAGLVIDGKFAISTNGNFYCSRNCRTYYTED